MSKADDRDRDEINQLFKKLDRRGTHPDSYIEWTEEGWKLVFRE